mgnify:CR=1 FL=1
MHWLGQQPFTEEKHVFTNMGDGTYFHSGLLAIRAAVAAKVPITYKLLINGFVAEIVEELENEPLVEALEEIITDWLEHHG